MANGNRGDNGRLAEKLRSEYRNRGASLNGVEATSTYELMKRAQMGRDPKVNVSAQAFDDRVRGRSFPENGGRGGAASGGRPTSGNPASRNPAGGSQGGGASRSADSRRGGVGGRTAGSGASARGTSQKRRPRSEKEFRADNKFSGGQRFGTEPRRVRYETEEPFEEIRVARKRIPAGFLLVLAFCTVMIMLILTSLAQIYQTTGEISDKEDAVQVLKESIDYLELKLDEKNDVRMIEQMATVELGMVKADSVQRKYISLSEGEHVELVGEDKSEEAAGGSTMLSGFFETFGGFFEYFK